MRCCFLPMLAYQHASIGASVSQARPHVSKRKLSYCAPLSKRFAYTLIVFISFFSRPHYKAGQERSHMVASARHFGYSRSSRLAPGRDYFDDVIVFRQHRFLRPHQKTAFSKSIVFKSLHSGEPFRMAPISGIVFGVLLWTMVVSGAKHLRLRWKTNSCGRGLSPPVLESQP